MQAADPGTPRRQYLLKATIVKKYGATKGCPGCTTVGRAHTEACRERLERLYHEEQAEVKKLQKEIDAVRDQLEDQEENDKPIVVDEGDEEGEQAVLD